MFTDLVKVFDQGVLKLINRVGDILDNRHWFEDDSKDVVSTKGWVKIIARERGKLVKNKCREGHNIWTNSGREHVALLLSIQTAPTTTFRSDGIAYIGVGTGSTIEDVGVLKLVTPVEYLTGQFLAALDVPPTFPLTPTRTTVQFRKLYAENEITLTPASQVNISELGLFTNGSPSAIPAYSPGTRDTGIANSGLQAPNAYKTFEPIGKTDSLQLEVLWEVRL